MTENRREVTFEAMITDKKAVKKFKKLIIQKEIQKENAQYQRMGVYGNQEVFLEMNENNNGVYIFPDNESFLEFMAALQEAYNEGVENE